jgi:hypothetical protein
MTIAEVKKYLDKGDYVKIARMSGLKPGRNSRQYVYEVLKGNYKALRGKAKRIIENAEIIANQNKETGKTIE